MKRIHLTKEEKILIRQFSRCDINLPEGMSQAAFVNTTIQLKKRGLVYAEVGLMKVNRANLTDEGKSYFVENPKLRNPIPERLVFDIITVIGAMAAVAALFVGCARLVAMYQ